MKLLVVAATQKELTKVYEHFNLPEQDFVSTPHFDVLITGVGMVATAYALGKHLNNSYNLVLNVGIAGSFDKNIPLGSLVNIIEDTFAELGADDGENFLTITDLGFGENCYVAKNDVKLNIPEVCGITVNRVSGNETNIKNLIARLNPKTESMEGAAIFYACAKEKIDCLQIRCISNYVEVRNKDNWELGLAIANLNIWAIAFLALPNPPQKGRAM